jgi:hypothetical protein
MLKLSYSYDSVRFILLKIWTEWVINCYILCHFSIPNHVCYHCWSQSCIALQLQLWLNDAAPCGSSSTTLVSTVQGLEPRFPAKIYYDRIIAGQNRRPLFRQTLFLEFSDIFGNRGRIFRPARIIFSTENMILVDVKS